VKLWSVETGKELKAFAPHGQNVHALAFSPDGQTIASASDDKTVKLWDVQTGELKENFTGHTDFVRGIAFSPDGTRLASGGRDQTVQELPIKSVSRATSAVVSVPTRAPSIAPHSIDMARLQIEEIPFDKKTIRDGVFAMAHSADGRWMATATFNESQAILIYDRLTGESPRQMLGHKFSIHSMAFSPDGETLASGSSDNSIKLWNVSTGRELKTLTGHSGKVKSVSFSPNGEILASGSSDNSIKLWNVSTGQELKPLIGHSDKVESVSFSPDGHTLASGSKGQ